MQSVSTQTCVGHGYDLCYWLCVSVGFCVFTQEVHCWLLQTTGGSQFSSRRPHVDSCCYQGNQDADGHRHANCCYVGPITFQVHQTGDHWEAAAIGWALCHHYRGSPLSGSDITLTKQFQLVFTPQHITHSYKLFAFEWWEGGWKNEMDTWKDDSVFLCVGPVFCASYHSTSRSVVQRPPCLSTRHLWVHQRQLHPGGPQ